MKDTIKLIEVILRSKELSDENKVESIKIIVNNSGRDKFITYDPYKFTLPKWKFKGNSESFNINIKNELL